VREERLSFAKQSRAFSGARVWQLVFLLSQLGHVQPEKDTIDEKGNGLSNKRSCTKCHSFLIQINLQKSQENSCKVWTVRMLFWHAENPFELGNAVYRQQSDRSGWDWNGAITGNCLSNECRAKSKSVVTHSNKLVKVSGKFVAGLCCPMGVSVCCKHIRGWKCHLQTRIWPLRLTLKLSHNRQVLI